MKIVFKMIRAALFLVLLTASSGTCFGLETQEDVDGVTGASKKMRRDWESLGKESLMILFNSKETVCVLSTKNADGSPHAEIIFPDLVDLNTIKFVSAPTPSRNNLDRDGKALLTIINRNVSANGRLTRSGARLMLNAKVDDNIKKNTRGLRVTHLQIEDVLPIK